LAKGNCPVFFDLCCAAVQGICISKLLAEEDKHPFETFAGWMRPKIQGKKIWKTIRVFF
jgi:hypothetical protein